MCIQAGAFRVCGIPCSQKEALWVVSRQGYLPVLTIAKQGWNLLGKLSIESDLKKHNGVSRFLLPFPQEVLRRS